MRSSATINGLIVICGHRAIAGLMVFCGLRSAEVLALDVIDVDIGARRLRVSVPIVGGHGWIVPMRDKRIRYRRPERDRLMTHGVKRST